VTTARDSRDARRTPRADAKRAGEKRTRLNPQARRTQLIELGVRMLATRTLDELSVDDIAAEAGISRGLLFHYFGSKQEFYVAVARAAAADLIARTEPDTRLEPVEVLRHSLEAFIAYVEEKPDAYKSLVRGAGGGDADLRALHTETRAALADRVVRVASELGFALDETAVLAVHGWVAMVEECTIGWLDSRAISRAQLQEMLARALPVLILAASDTDLDNLVALLA